MPELVPARVRDCACPGNPHAEEGDVVYLLPALPFDGGAIAEQQMFAANGDRDLLARQWTRTFIEHGAVGWNLLDEDGEPVPFSVQAILADWRIARPLVEPASDLYSDGVLAPFQTASRPRSPTGPTAPGTSRTRRRTPDSSD